MIGVGVVVGADVVIWDGGAVVAGGFWGGLL